MNKNKKELISKAPGSKKFWSFFVLCKKFFTPDAQSHLVKDAQLTYTLSVDSLDPKLYFS
jgi:hypothetical protein